MTQQNTHQLMKEQQDRVFFIFLLAITSWPGYYFLLFRKRRGTAGETGAEFQKGTEAQLGLLGSLTRRPADTGLPIAHCAGITPAAPRRMRKFYSACFPGDPRVLPGMLTWLL